MRGKYLLAGVTVAGGSFLLAYILHAIPNIWPLDALMGVFGLAAAFLLILVGLLPQGKES